jgi:quercetin dioxygenase-like cupin family protein
VSKQLLKKNNGKVTLLASDKGESLNDSTSPNDILVNVLEGTIDLKVNGTSNLVETADYFSLPSKIPHSIGEKEKTKVSFTVIK